MTSHPPYLRKGQHHVLSFFVPGKLAALQRETGNRNVCFGHMPPANHPVSGFPMS